MLTDFAVFKGSGGSGVSYLRNFGAYAQTVVGTNYVSSILRIVLSIILNHGIRTSSALTHVEVSLQRNKQNPMRVNIS
jgi:hypothetical protein